MTSELGTISAGLNRLADVGRFQCDPGNCGKTGQQEQRSREGVRLVLQWRLLSSLLIVSLLLTAAYFDWRMGQPTGWDRPGLGVLLLMPLFGGLTAIEFASLILPNDRDRAARWMLVAITLGVIVVGCLPALFPAELRQSMVASGWPIWAVVVGLLLTFCREMLVYDPAAVPPSTQVTTRISGTALSLLYLGLPLALLADLRLSRDNGFGLWALLTVLVIPKVNDAAAYFTGRAIGRLRLIPRLSPGKTVEGALGGLVAGVLASAAMWWLVAPGLFGIRLELAWGWAIVYGLCLSLVGMLGDLAESLMKRDAQIKDSGGGWLPGLGGLLDVVDSVLFASLAAYGFWRCFPGAN